MERRARLHAAISVERLERDAQRKVAVSTKYKQKGKSVLDANRRDNENVPLTEDVQAYFRREVMPHASDAWIDEEKKVVFEIPFNRQLYVWKPPPPLPAIDAELKEVTERIVQMLLGRSQ